MTTISLINLNAIISARDLDIDGREPTIDGFWRRLTYTNMSGMFKNTNLLARIPDSAKALNDE